MRQALTIFYDSYCPLCVKEMQKLDELDKKNQLAFIDIHSTTFTLDFTHINKEAANEILHAQDSNGILLKGLDVTYEAWRLVGKGYWIKPFRWPLLRTIADKCYLLFARHRYQISYCLTGQQPCQNGACLPKI